jgi:O-antigen ligase
MRQSFLANSISPPRQELRRRIACWIGTLGLAAVAIGFGASTSAVNIGLALLVVGAILVVDDIHRALKPAEYGLIAALVAFVCLNTLWAVQVLQVDAELASDSLRELLKVAGITALAAGWWMTHGRLSLRLLLTLLVVGIVLGTLPTINYQGVLAGAGRLHLTSMNPNELGFFAGTLLLLSVIALLPGGVANRADSKFSSWFRALFLVSSLVAVGMISLSQSRAILLAGVGSLVLVIGIRSLRSASRGDHSKRHLVIAAVVTLLLTTALLLSPIGKMLGDRFDSLENSIYLFTSIGSDSTPPAGFRDQVRLLLWRDGLAQIKLAPFLGHGPGTPETFISATGIAEIAHYKHYHNFWVNTLVSIGAVGTIGYLVLFFSLTLVALRDAVKTDTLSSWMALALWFYFLIIILVQLRINHPSGQAFFALAGGMSLHHLFASRSAPAQP